VFHKSPADSGAGHSFSQKIAQFWEKARTATKRLRLHSALDAPAVDHIKGAANPSAQPLKRKNSAEAQGIYYIRPHEENPSASPG
jgi:hypothetical protein